jgi:hypothetical protein
MSMTWLLNFGLVPFKARFNAQNETGSIKYSTYIGSENEILILGSGLCQLAKFGAQTIHGSVPTVAAAEFQMRAWGSLSIHFFPPNVSIGPKLIRFPG